MNISDFSGVWLNHQPQKGAMGHVLFTSIDLNLDHPSSSSPLIPIHWVSFLAIVFNRKNDEINHKPWDVGVIFRQPPYAYLLWRLPSDNN